MSWWQRLWDSTNRTATFHDLAYIVGVAFFLAWLNHGVYKGKGFTDGWNQTAIIFATLIGGAQVTALIANRKQKGDAA